jgi:hypothetical protein
MRFKVRVRVRVVHDVVQLERCHREEHVVAREFAGDELQKPGPEVPVDGVVDEDRDLDRDDEPERKERQGPVRELVVQELVEVRRAELERQDREDHDVVDHEVLPEEQAVGA